MTDYTELVKALRCGEYKPECGSSDCPYWSGLGCMDGQLMEDAAAAIEALQAQMPKRGKWVRVEDGESYHYECSECGERPLYSRFGDIVLSGVCPMCGAKMTEVQE